MADKNKAGGGDDWDNWDNDDLNWDPDLGDTKDDRKPVTRFGVGALKGIRDDILSMDRIKGIAKNALPSGYGDGMDLIDKFTSSTMDLYNEAVKDVRPTVKGAKRLATQLTKDYRDRLPDFAKNITDRWESEARVEDEQAARNREWDQSIANREDDDIARQVTEALGDMANAQADQFAESQASDAIKQDIADKRYANTSRQMAALQQGMAAQVGFNNEFAARYMRKSLELKYKGIAIQRAQLEQHRKVSELSLQLLQNIQKNTGLPDFVKANTSDRVKQATFQRLFGKTLDSISSGGFENKFFGNMVENVRNSVVRNVQGFMGTAQELISAGGDMKDAMGMTDGFDEGTRREMQGQMAGQALASFVVPWLASKAGQKMQSLAKKYPDSAVGSAMKVVNERGDNAAYLVRNMGKLLQEDILKNRYSADQSLVGELGRGLGSMAFTFDRGRNFTVANQSAEELAESTSFDRLSYRTLNEVIPGYLARLLQSSEGIRTGKKDSDHEVYDQATGRFVSGNTRQAAAQDSLFEKRTFSDYGKGFNDVLAVIDPEKEMSDRARKALMKQMARDSDANIAFDPMRFLKAGNFDRSIDRAAIAEIQAYVRKRYGVRDETDDDGNVSQVIDNKGQFYTERNKADLRYGYMKQRQPDIQRRLNLMRNTGDTDLLVRMGILTEQGDGSYTVNHDRYFSEIDRYIDDPTYADRAAVDTRFQRGENAAAIAQPGGGRGSDRRTSKALNRLSGEVGKLNGILPSVGRTDAQGLLGYNQWWNEQGVITNSLEEQTRSWQQIQLEAEEHASEQRQLMLELLQGLHDETVRGNAAAENESELPLDNSVLGRVKRLAGAQWRGLREGSGLLNKGIGAGAKGAGKVAGFLGKRLPGAAMAGGSFVKNLMVNSASRVLGFQSSLLRTGGNMARKLSDVYVLGETAPRLLAAKMRQGHYIDQKSGKPIKSVKDIKGPVEDLEGNVVLTAEDFEKGLTNRWGMAIDSSGIREWVSGTRSWLGQQYGRLTNVPGMIKSAMKSAYAYLDRPVDIYVAGETTPRLLSMVMLNGGYFRQSDNKPVLHYKDIDGEVLDAQGNVVLTHGDMRKGLVDKDGKPLRNLKDKLMDFGAKAAMLPLTLVRKGKELLGKLSEGAKKQLKRLGDWWNDPSSMLVGTTTGIIDRLDAIHDLLDQRMPGGEDKDYRDWNGDGIREGSLEDLRRKREAKEGKETDADGKPKGKDGEEKKGGLLSKLGDLFTNSALGKKIMASPLGKVLGGLGTMLGGGGGLLKGGMQVLGGVGKGALGLAGWAGRGALAAGSLAWSAMGGAAGLGALLLNPITLTIGGVALAGWAAWKIYKHFADKPDPMQKLRLHAYGARGDDSDFNEKLLKMETYLTEHVVDSGDGTVGFDPKTDAKTLLEIWDIKPEDSDRISEWGAWFQNRFTPVFARAWKLFRDLLPDSKKYMEMDNDPDGAAKIKWSEEFIWPGDDPHGPYYIEANPLGADKADLYLAGPGVKDLMLEQLAVIKKKYEGQVKKFTRDEAMARWSTLSDTQRKQIAPYALRGQKAANRFNDMDYRRASGEARRKLDATAVVEGVDRKGKKWVTGGAIDELTSLRIRAYGLKVPLLSHIKTLLKLEELIEPGVITRNDQAVYNGDLAEIYKQVASEFGRDIANAKDRTIWVNWMNNRFLPAYLTLYNEARKRGGGNGLLVDVVQNLKDSDRYDIGNAIISAQYKDKTGKHPVWTWNSCGFQGVEANLDSSSTLTQMEQLKAAMDKEKVREKEGGKESEKNEALAKQQEQMMIAAGYEKKDGVWKKRSHQLATTKEDQEATARIRAQGGRTTIGLERTGAMNTDIGGMGEGTATYDTGGVSNAGLMKPAKGPGAEAGRKHLIKAAVKFGITNPMELAMLLANVEHESGNYAHLRELNYKNPERLRAVFPKYFRSVQDAAAAIQAGPAAVFERVYGGRMGNNQKGDGARYPGRGYIQVTGKDNYARISKIIGKDLLAHPEYLETPVGAAEGSVAWWMMQGDRIRKPAQAGQIDATRKVVNGGLNGIQDVRQRSAYWIQAAKTGELAKLMAEARGGEVEETPTSPGEVQADNQAPDEAVAATAGGTPTQAAAPGAAPAPDGSAVTPGSYAAGKQAAVSEAVSTPSQDTMPANPAAQRGVGVPSTPTQVQQSATQTATASENFYGTASEVLTKQLQVQERIATNTENTALKMEELIQAIKGMPMGQQQQDTGTTKTQRLPDRPQGVSPIRQRYSH